MLYCVLAPFEYIHHPRKQNYVLQLEQRQEDVLYIQRTSRCQVFLTTSEDT